MFTNPVLFAVITYGLTAAIALGVAGIIWLISRAVKGRGGAPGKE